MNNELTDEQIYKGNVLKKNTIRFDHFIAIFYRRWILFKRSSKTTIMSIIASVFFCSLTLIAQYLISTLAHEKVEMISFKSYNTNNSNIVLVFNQSDPQYIPYIETLTKMFYNDTGHYPNYYNFSNRFYMNAWMYRNAGKKPDKKVSIITGFIFNKLNDTTEIYDIPVLFNSSIGFDDSISRPGLFASVQVSRLKWKHIYGFDKDIKYSVTTLSKRSLDHLFGNIAPMLLSGSLLSLIPLFVSQPIIDTVGEVRDYMVSSSLTLFPYYAAIFLFDFILWIIAVTLQWGLLAIFRTRAILDNAFTTWYNFVMCGPSFIIFNYCISFCFSSPESASRVAFITLSIILLIPIIVDIIRNYADNPLWYEWFLSFFPFGIMQRSQMCIYVHIGYLREPLKYYMTSKQHQAFFIMQYIDCVIYGIVLTIIENVRLKLRRGSAQHIFQGFSEFFAAEKARHHITDEAKQMELETLTDNPNSDSAVKIISVSRLFFDTAGKPVPAVNCVSLNIKRNSIFGFLGANGAGKTTLIKMITSLLPPSDGKILVEGNDISKFYNPRILSICPQFNNHLCPEMTANEHFYVYSLIHGLCDEYIQKTIPRLIEGLDLEEIKDRPLRELSGGDERKVAIALSFLAPAKIILLDEPTASLDPVARRKVHEMILSFKGQKTFMLCTHLLSEAEYLCDMISIMIKGCVYTCGTSQYLTQKFGKDYRIEVILKDELGSTERKCNQFFSERLPNSILSITRRKARIYLVPAHQYSLPQLFRIMQEGQNGDYGITYFTCSSSSLERVFMELIHMSETDDMEFANSNP